MVSGIILAAGESRRMGSPKQLLPLGGVTILERVVRNILASQLGEVILVLGHRAKSIERSIRLSFGGYPLKIVTNRRYRQGMSTSIIAGLLAAREESDAFLIALGDQPFIGPQVVDRLLEAQATSGRGIVLPSFQGQVGHPALFHRRYREELLRLTGDVGARSLLGAHPEDLLVVEVDSEGVLADIDRWEDYQRLLAAEGAPWS